MQINIKKIINYNFNNLIENLEKAELIALNTELRLKGLIEINKQYACHTKEEIKLATLKINKLGRFIEKIKKIKNDIKAFQKKCITISS